MPAPENIPYMRPIGCQPLRILWLWFPEWWCSREVQRLESTMKSPTYTHFQETLNGVNVIRAFQSTSRFRQENREKIDYHNRAWWLIHAGLNRWLGIRLELVGTLVREIIVGNIVGLLLGI
jgi:ABC-type multidrug transport system fused ATPase/permease subunit